MAYSEKTAGFLLKTKEIVDRRLVLSKSEMLNKKFADGTSFSKFLPVATGSPAYLFTFCSDDLSLYYYHENNADSAETGKFVKMAGGAGGGIVDVNTLPSSPDPASIYRTPNGVLHTAIITSEGVIWTELLQADSEGEIPVTKEVDTLPTNPVPGVIYTKQNTAGDNTFHIYQDGAWYELAMAWEGTQLEYENLPVKQAATIYFIKD